MDEVGWGIIGCGDVCERKSGPPLYEIDGSRLLGVTRRDAAKGADFAARHGPCEYHPDVSDLLAMPEIDAIYVATPDDLHCEGTVAAAAAGKHVLCEKAMAKDAAECDRMVAACRDADVTLGVAYYRRCYPSMLRVKALLDEGAIGEPRRMWINDQFPLSHRIDLAHFFFGDQAEIRVDEEGLPPDSHADHGAVLHAFSASGVESVMNVGWDETHDIEVLRFDGSAGRIEVDDLKKGTMRLVRDGDERDETQPPLRWTHWGLIENFVRHLQGRAPLACDGVEGRKSTVIEDSIAGARPGGGAVPIAY